MTKELNLAEEFINATPPECPLLYEPDKLICHVCPVRDICKIKSDQVRLARLKATGKLPIYLFNGGDEE